MLKYVLMKNYLTTFYKVKDFIYDILVKNYIAGMVHLKQSNIYIFIIDLC